MEGVWANWAKQEDRLCAVGAYVHAAHSLWLVHHSLCTTHSLSFSPVLPIILARLSLSQFLRSAPQRPLASQYDSIKRSCKRRAPKWGPFAADKPNWMKRMTWHESFPPKTNSELARSPQDRLPGRLLIGILAPCYSSKMGCLVNAARGPSLDHGRGCSESSLFKARCFEVEPEAPPNAFGGASVCVYNPLAHD